MAFKTVFTLTHPDLGDGDLNMATALCEETEAHLSVLVVAIAAPPPVSEFAAPVTNAWLEERQADLEKLRRRVAAISARLSSGPVSSDLSSEYPEMARADDVIGRRARYADITVLCRDVLSRDALKSKAIEGALFHSGKPLLLVPGGSLPTLKPKRVAVAWDAGLEASKAVSQSLSLLIAADEVRLVLVDPVAGEDRHGAEPGADAAAYLARHGVKVTIDRIPSQGRTVSSAICQYSIDASADLLVMGAYGHSRLRERVFGGVTKSMLDKPPLPILLAR